MVDMGQTNNELTVQLIDLYTILQEIKTGCKEENPILNYKIRKVEAQLHSIGVNTDNLKL